MCGEKHYTTIPKIDVEKSGYEKWENGTTRNGNLICVLKSGQRYLKKYIEV